jgi:hypothetical protein
MVAVIARREPGVTRLADSVAVSCSRLSERLKTGPKPQARYRTSQDAELLAALDSLVDCWPCREYRRDSVLSDRPRCRARLPRINCKRIRGLVEQDGPPLRRYIRQPPGWVAGAPIIRIRPNLSSTSKGLEIACRNGKVPRAVSAFENCDRKVTAPCAATGGAGGESPLDRMRKSIEQRFGAQSAAKPVRWLAGNGGGCLASDTIASDIRLGPIPCFPSFRRPRSTGMTTAFGKTFRRNDVHAHDRPDSQTVVSQLSTRFEDHNEIHPHKPQRMQPTRELIRGDP